MTYSEEEIYQLLIEKLSGTISPEDDDIIEKLLVENSAIREQWGRITNQLKEAEQKGFSTEVNIGKKWRDFESAAHPISKFYKLTPARITVAVAVLLLIVTSLYIYTEKETTLQVTETLSHETTIPKKIVLSLGSTETIYISPADNQIIQAGTTRINAGNDGLSYTSGGTGATEWNSLKVPSTMDYKILLSDGTEVWLNSQSELDFPLTFPGKSREVYIRGEAFFKVAKNSSQPFIVQTPQTSIKVLGTQFNVNTYDTLNIRTSLVDGAVQTAAGSDVIKLKPGLEATYRSGKGFITGSFEESEVLSWMKGVFYFHNAPLGDLVKLLPRWFDVQVQFENVSLQNKTFSGALIKNQPLERFLENLQLSAGVNFAFNNGVVHLK